MRNQLGLIILLIFFQVCSFGQDLDQEFDYGKVEESNYSNSYFNFEITLPKDWVIQSKEQMENISKTGKELIAGDDETMKATLKASEINTANLFSAFQYERGTPVDYNPSIMLVAESLKNAPGVKSGGDYLFLSRRLLEQSKFKYDHLDKEFEKEAIGGRDFHKMNAFVKYMGIDIRQIYFATVTKGFGLILIISYSTEDQKVELLSAVNSMQFK